QEYFYNIQAKEVSYNRLQFTKRMFEVGERPAIDTVEAFAQYKLLEYETQKSYYNWVKSAIELSLFLWDENDQAVFIKDNITPLIYNTRYLLDSITLPSLNDLELLVLNHPKLNAFDIKLKNLEIERKLKFQNLLPTLNVNYNFINKSYNPFYNVGDNLLLNNYKIGVDFKMPLMFREARGEYKQAKIKIESTQIDKVVVQNELNVKVKTYYNDLVALKENLRLYNETFLAYETLLKGENTRFENGESSLFLINSRQNKVLETRLKMNELESKLMKYRMSVYLLAGQQSKN
ncbi:MAG: TolC family protein, partial [Chitinophagales bacterium]|nr:TolC family protein [Chitinophagales bacterium]